MRRKTVGNKVVSVLLAGALAKITCKDAAEILRTRGQMQEITQRDAGTKEDTKSAETETAKRYGGEFRCKEWLTVATRQRI